VAAIVCRLCIILAELIFGLYDLSDVMMQLDTTIQDMGGFGRVEGAGATLSSYHELVHNL
jgi:hypothetical protein